MRNLKSKIILKDYAKFDHVLMSGTEGVIGLIFMEGESTIIRIGSILPIKPT